MIDGFDIGKDIQNAFDDGYNRGFDDVIKIIEGYKNEDRLSLQHEILLECLLEKIIISKNNYNKQ